jgi:hypothetical protein
MAGNIEYYFNILNHIVGEGFIYRLSKVPIISICKNLVLLYNGKQYILKKDNIENEDINLLNEIINEYSNQLYAGSSSRLEYNKQTDTVYIICDAHGNRMHQPIQFI